MTTKPSFDRIFRLTGTHLAAGALGFAIAVAVFAPKPRVATLDARARQVLELGHQAHAAANASAGPALEQAVKLCDALHWPACDAGSVRQMGIAP